jgi:alpha-L-rhamnosidase
MKASIVRSVWAFFAPVFFFAVAAHGKTPSPAKPPSLEKGFVDPPATAKPLVWWHWMNGNVTRDGVTKDLEAMARIGLGGVQIFTAHLSTPVTVANPIRYLSPEWLEMIRHAAAECDRLGLEMTIHSAAGWSETGGTWVKPDEAMQKLVWSETIVDGPKHFSAALPAPPSVYGPFQGLSHARMGRKPAAPGAEKFFYRDVVTLAFPAVAGDAVNLASARPTMTSNAAVFDGRITTDGDLNTRQLMTFPTTGEKSLFVRLDFTQPFVARALTLATLSEVLPFELQVPVEGGGGTWRTVIADTPPSLWSQPTPKTIAFPAVSSRSYRLVFKPRDERQKSFELAELDLTPAARINRFEDKAGFALLSDYGKVATPATGSDGTVAPARVIDLSHAMGANGQLTWDVPPGRWTVIRFGHSATGHENGPAPDDARGLEVDKLDRASVEAYFDGFMNPIAQALGPLFGKSLSHVLMDSWEAGQQNWTPRFTREFSRRRGYDPMRFLPAMAGKVVASPEQSDRFLEDVRRTLGDLVAENHYGAFKDRLHARGLGLYAESIGIGQPMFADGLQVRGMPDIPMGEFWVKRKDLDRTPDCKLTSSAAHIYGKPIAAAEAFTAAPDKPAYGMTPYAMKALGDLHFATGINRFVIHEYAHQPSDDRKPGFTLGPFGTQFNRQITWWEQARVWMSYLSRSQFLLQQGNFVGDVLYFYGESVPVTVPGTKNIKPEPPAGYDYDFVNAEVLLSRISAGKDGRLLLPDGTTYRVLVLTSTIVSPLVLKKIQSLVQLGVTVVGPRPQRSLGLGGYPAVDAEVARLADNLWGACQTDSACENKVGSQGGKVVTGKPLADVLAGLGVAPDFKTISAAADANIIYFHRKTDDADLYFVANQLSRMEDVTLHFRVTGKAPELWDPNRGTIARAPEWRRDAGGTQVRLRMDPAGSLFVVFRRPGTPPPAVVATATKVRPGFDVPGPWNVAFPAQLGAPASVTFDRLVSWPEHADEGVRYFSGTATYSTTVDLPAAMRGKMVLSLGEVKDFAEVVWNGKSQGVLWKPPFEVDLPGLAGTGKNQLEVRITNLWPNRLIGDARLPEAQRLTWTTDTQYTKDSPLIPSGLLGPVRITVR